MGNTALQAHPGFASLNAVNVLASGRHLPDVGAMGSGIYTDGGIANYTFKVDMESLNQF